MRWSRRRPPPATSTSAPSSSRRSPPSAAPARTSSSPTTPRTPPDGFRPDRHAEAPQPQGRRGGAARRLRPPAAQRDAGQLPDRAAPVRGGRARARRARGAGPRARAGADRRPHHPPGHADLRHARAGIRLDARRRARRSRAPVAGGEDHQLAPRRVAQLPAQPRLQHVVHDRGRGGLEARSARHARPAAGAHGRRVDPPAADAQAVQDPHGPRHGGRHRGPAAARRRPRAGRARAPALRRLRPRRHPRDAGRHAGRRRAVRPRRGRARHRRRQADRASARHGRARPPAPRGRDPVPPARRLQRERHGRLESARRPCPRDRAEDGRDPRHQPLLPAPDVRGLALPALHDGPRPLEGGVRRRARCRGGVGARPSGPRDPLQLDRVQEDPFAVLHRRLPQLGTRARGRVSGSGTASLRDTRSAEVYARALTRLPGGVNSPVRAMKAIGRTPLFVDRASGAEIIDVDGNRYVDWVCSWGPLVHGHAHPDVLAAVVAAAQRGTTFGAPTAAEVDLADEVARRMPAVPMLRMTSSGTEAAMSAIRLARAATGREKVLKFAGAYHGHVDGLLAEAGSGPPPRGIPASPGVPASATAATVIVPWNDPEAVRRAFAEHEFAAVLCEPYPANMGLIPPAAGFLELLRDLCTGYDALLVFDEVITGFRVAPGGAQELTGVLPDLTITGEILGGGLPGAAFGGPLGLMEQIAPAGDVYQAGTLSGNPLAVAAGRAALALLDEQAYLALSDTTHALADGLREAAGERPVSVTSTT